MSVWFVTGSSRGLGAEIVRTALAHGHQVAATARDAETVRRAFPDAGDALLATPLDVTDEVSIAAAVEATVERFGRIDVVVNNAGFGTFGAVEEVSDRAVRAVFDTNYFGAVNVVRAVLPTLRGQRSGHVLNISSVGGFDGVPGAGAYAASKFALEGMSESLHAELAPLGIKVTIVEPGGFRTDFLDASSIYVEPHVIEDYAATSGETRQVPGLYNHAQAGDPVKLAAALLKVTESDDPPLRLPLGPDSVERIEAKINRLNTELASWRSVALSTDHADQTDQT